MSIDRRCIMVLNTGSSSVKFEVFEAVIGDRELNVQSLTRGIREEVTNIDAALQSVFDDTAADTGDVDAFGHRVVHGGERFTEPTLIDDSVLAAIEELSPLAPLHNPPAVAAIASARTLRPGVPNVAVFDTAFHQTMRPEAYRYAIADSWYREYGIRRFGFHGTSHRFVAAAAAAQLGRPESELKLITLHLGNGASAAAIDGGTVIDTSMGFSPLEGLVMGTRPGDLDVGVIFELRRRGLSDDQIEDAINHDCGLRGLSGDSDMRALHRAADAGDADAELAIEIFCRRIRGYLGTYLAHLGGCDAVVFTGGIGEHDDEVRRRVIDPLGHLDLGEILVIATDEERLIALDTVGVIESRPRS